MLVEIVFDYSTARRRTTCKTQNSHAKNKQRGEPTFADIRHAQLIGFFAFNSVRTHTHAPAAAQCIFIVETVCDMSDIPLELLHSQATANANIERTNKNSKSSPTTTTTAIAANNSCSRNRSQNNVINKGDLFVTVYNGSCRVCACVTEICERARKLIKFN